MMNPFLNKAKLPTHLKYKLLLSSGGGGNLLKIENPLINVKGEYIHNGNGYTKIATVDSSKFSEFWINYAIFLRVENLMDLEKQLNYIKLNDVEKTRILFKANEVKMFFWYKKNGSNFEDIVISDNNTNSAFKIGIPYLLEPHYNPELEEKLIEVGYTTREEQVRAMCEVYNKAWVFDDGVPEYFYINLDKIV